ncbi:co-chaperone DjlA [Echinimonas agarilytica]|uniref:Co-chaperone protein DjlA n=1 Tax=Echinimonas agarilytica TaxID=1215918 RepID=A0AA41W8Z8_9GAMM|nr:co-chaperone DjlA [Echinimonas agarilytica]MCM2681289.1 co-chaperone DjlA [Echinimonas agarilytica]
MPYWGKVLGFGFGLMLGNIFGALLGLWIGHLFDRGMSREFSQRGGFGGMFNQNSAQLTNHMVFLYTSYAVMGHMAKASGQVTQADIAVASAIMDRMGLKGERRKEMQEAHREGRVAGFPLRDRLREFKEACFGRHDVMQVFLEIQLQAAFADGELHTREQQILYTIADELGFARSSLDQLFSMWQAEQKFKQHAKGATPHDRNRQLSEAYRILGVQSTDDMTVIKKAYRKLMAQHHPDKLMAKGVPEEALTMAKEKTQDIQAAYELIKSQR